MDQVENLAKRAYTYGYYYSAGACPSGYVQSGNYCYTKWSLWGRWVLLGAVIFVVLAFGLCCVCMARRRRRKGAKPMKGFGWAAPATAQQQQPVQQQYYPQDQQPAAYQQPQQGGYYNQQQQGGYANPPGYENQNQNQNYNQTYPTQPQTAYAPPPGAPTKY